MLFNLRTKTKGNHHLKMDKTIAHLIQPRTCISYFVHKIFSRVYGYQRLPNRNERDGTWSESDCPEVVVRSSATFTHGYFQIKKCIRRFARSFRCLDCSFPFLNCNMH
ncbi:hypothetical protein AVEN_57589-1 [Araneus ventricosus]|uniref:Uncharacterized protein n=1 Tax=Araneus ventricosus TaxID=182803 RepID=A0A4Y2PXQ7_ARAVE|nr:hypothetical protein AVEN_57589-1 [Araneus ventricosus]